LVPSSILAQKKLESKVEIKEPKIKSDFSKELVVKTFPKKSKLWFQAKKKPVTVTIDVVAFWRGEIND